jgi:transposase
VSKNSFVVLSLVCEKFLRNVFHHPEFIEPSSRLTTRLRTLIQAIGVAFNANGGARLGVQMGIQVSRMTMLFSLHLLTVQPIKHVIHVGIDDFAWKRGLRYGTVIIDLDTHQIIDILPDREAESVRKWLATHPEIEVVSRDRGGAYADGAAQGAPQAIQCADRWHICKNLGDAVEEYLKRQPLSIPAPAQSISETKETPRSQHLQMHRESRSFFLKKHSSENKQLSEKYAKCTCKA